ncbi:hypothetical protein QM340_30320, partial [Pseudomonas aeruginosa]|nr:hypothetical protein [Pseudomonas aeruginosa]
DYLTKPIDEQQLAQVVLKWTGLSLGQSLASMSRAPQLGQLSVLDPEEGLRLAAAGSFCLSRVSLVWQAAALDELDKAIEALADTASATTHLSSTSLDSSEL